MSFSTNEAPTRRRFRHVTCFASSSFPAFGSSLALSTLVSLLSFSALVVSTFWGTYGIDIAGGIGRPLIGLSPLGLSMIL